MQRLFGTKQNPSTGSSHFSINILSYVNKNRNSYVVYCLNNKEFFFDNLKKDINI